MKKSVEVLKALLTNYLQGIFARRKSRAAPLDDNKSENSLNINAGVFEKSLTMEEENQMAKVRRLVLHA